MLSINRPFHIYEGQKVSGISRYSTTAQGNLQAVVTQPVIPVLKKVRLEDIEVEASLGYLPTFCLKQKQKYGTNSNSNNVHKQIYN